MGNLAPWLERTLSLSPEIQGKILASVVAIASLWLLHRVFVRVAWRRIEDVRLRYQWRKLQPTSLLPWASW
jgi:hypothetical protein